MANLNQEANLQNHTYYTNNFSNLNGQQTSQRRQRRAPGKKLRGRSNIGCVSCSGNKRAATSNNSNSTQSNPAGLPDPPGVLTLVPGQVPVNTPPLRYATTWQVRHLVSDKPNQAAHQDTDLVNPWGLVIRENLLWVVNNTSDRLTSYDIYGNKVGASIDIRDAQHRSAFFTGIVSNCSGGLLVRSCNHTGPAQFILASEVGTITGCTTVVGTANAASVAVNMATSGEVHVFRGLTIADGNLYIADFMAQKILVFDSNFVIQHTFPFVDGEVSNPIPDDYGPSNIVNIGTYLYVLYARHNPSIPLTDVGGMGTGYVSVFNTDGTFVRRLISKGYLNSPWAMIPAPQGCGFPFGGFLIGNNGDGFINVYDSDGNHFGRILNAGGVPVMIDGLWGLAMREGCDNEIYFTASSDQDRTGILGCMTRDQIVQY